MPGLEPLEHDLRGRHERDGQECADDASHAGTHEEADDDQERLDADGVAHDHRHENIGLHQLDDDVDERDDEDELGAVRGGHD